MLPPVVSGDVSWQRRYFKGKEVWVEVDHIGDLVIREGRVPMKYKNAEDARVYGANPRNLSNKPADLIDAEETFAKQPARGGTKSKSPAITATESSEQWGPRRESTEVPEELLELGLPVPGIIELYTDGACSGNPGPCGYGAILRDKDLYREISQYLGIGTNNIAELMGIRVALESVEERDRPVRLYTDSSYCIGVLTKGWKAKANRELILSIRQLLEEFSDIQFRKVKGHSGHPFNERADFLATTALEHRTA
jgi:ribonuclease HI